MTRETLIQDRNTLMETVDKERQYNKTYGIKHLGPESRKLLDMVWDIDEQIMELTP